jgi:DNA-directed RNA polymerase subunit M/transcription elongation factor TFIIS
MWKAKLKPEAIQSFQRPNPRTSGCSSEHAENNDRTTKTKATTPPNEVKQLHESSEIEVNQVVREIPNGRRAIECKRCHQMKAYCYNRYSKRGGSKSLYRCVECQNQWSEFYCDEEDYDFLSG